MDLEFSAKIKEDLKSSISGQRCLLFKNERRTLEKNNRERATMMCGKKKSEVMEAPGCAFEQGAGVASKSATDKEQVTG